MGIYTISGNFKLGSQWKKFTREVEAETEDHAREHLIKTYGSKHKLPKRFINIVEVYRMTKAAISSPSVSRREESTVAQITDHSVVLNGKEEDTKENRKED